MELEHLDIYGELGIAQDASDREIVTAYRKQALKFHPDKNPLEEAKQKFQLLTTIYAVLSDKTLREQYEQLRRQKGSQDESLSDEIRQFREKIRRAEQDQAKVYEDAVLTEQKIHVLQKEAQELRYEFERERVVESSGYTSFRDLEFTGRITDLRMDVEQDRTVEVKWKVRSEPQARIDDDVLKQVMEVFGPVEQAKVEETREGYGYGSVLYENNDSAVLAAAHDYKQSARRWENTKFRKVASLLRDCKLRQNHVPISAYAQLVLEQWSRRKK